MEGIIPQWKNIYCIVFTNGLTEREGAVDIVNNVSIVLRAAHIKHKMRKPRPLLRHAGKAAIDTKQRRPTVTVVRGRLEKPE